MMWYLIFLQDLLKVSPQVSIRPPQDSLHCLEVTPKAISKAIPHAPLETTTGGLRSIVVVCIIITVTSKVHLKNTYRLLAGVLKYHCWYPYESIGHAPFRVSL